MSRSESATPLELVYAEIDTNDGLPVTPRLAAVNGARERLVESLGSLGLSLEAADALGWTWCDDTRALPGVRGDGRARPFAGIVGPRRSATGDAGWFCLPVPPGDGESLLTPAPRHVLAMLPDVQLRQPSAPLHLASNPVVAARLWADGHRVAWINGGNGWRGPNRRPLADLAALSHGDIVVLHPEASCWSEPAVFNAWQALGKLLAAAGVEVRVATAEGHQPLDTSLGRQRRPESPRQRADRELKEQLLHPSAPAELRQPAFADALDRADRLYANPGAAFIGRAGLAAETCARAVVNCLEHVCRGPGGVWAYDLGLWRPAWCRDEGHGGAVGTLLVRLLRDDYRPAHETTVLATLARLADLPVLAAHPQTDGWAVSAYDLTCRSAYDLTCR